MAKRKSPKINKALFFIIPFLVIALGLIYVKNYSSSSSSNNVQTSESNLFDFRNQTYEINGEQITLKNGGYTNNLTGSDFQRLSASKPTLSPSGKLAAATLIETKAGTANQYDELNYIVGAMETKDGIIYSAPILIGDGVLAKIINIKVLDPGEHDNGQIQVNYQKGFSNQAEQMTRIYAFEENGNLIEVLN